VLGGQTTCLKRQAAMAGIASNQSLEKRGTFLAPNFPPGWSLVSRESAVRIRFLSAVPRRWPAMREQALMRRRAMACAASGPT
jgi:hypothetical protein